MKKQKDADSGQTSMFDFFAAEEHGLADEVPAPDGDEWDKGIKLKFEKEMLGIYVSDHPLREIAEVIAAARTMSLGATDEFRDGMGGWFAGIISAFDRVATKAGKLMATFTLEDLEGSMDGVLFPQVYEKYRDIVGLDMVVRMRAKVERSDRGLKLIVHEIEPLSESGQFERPPGTLMVRADLDFLGNGGGVQFKEILGAVSGPRRGAGRDAHAEWHETAQVGG